MFKLMPFYKQSITGMETLKFGLVLFDKMDV
jgi:hypothetical protein